MRAPSKRGRTHRYVGSADRRTIEQRGRLTRQALEDLGDAERDRRRGLCDRRRIGRDRRNAHHGAARSRRSLAAVLMPGVIMRGSRRHRRGVDVLRHAGARRSPHAPAAHRHEYARRRWSGTRSSGTTRRRQAPARRRARARKTDRAGRQTTPLWRAPASSSERTWRQPNAHASRIEPSTTDQGTDGSAAPSQLHAQYRGNVA